MSNPDLLSLFFKLNSGVSFIDFFFNNIIFITKFWWHNKFGVLKMNIH